ncbi:hypothetical protein HOLleu_36062 [Holothuria leucospilota]|uniref:Zinc finger PHD-type domain-containing protein n=1 Tax=Holothuria leucospilota TaxID=206669 RepID=A0A9Q1BFG3_HOLLE|nr:hypothetical protein HOLleu_36062 [Holothuria leucospilota]
MLAEYIKQLCEENHLDLTLLKTKEDRIQALQMLPNLRDAGLNLNNSSREKPVETFNVKLKGFHVLTSDDDVECYLSTFERLCIKHDIPEANWTIILESFLTGKAQRAYFALTENEKEDYQLVKESVLYAYQLTPSTYREKFRNASKNSSETFRQFSSRLFLYLRRWLNPSDDLLSSKGSQITVFTDHKALVWMLRNKALKGKLVRWALRLQEFDYTVHYRPGIQNMIPDALSRAPQICSIDYDSNVCFHEDCKGDPSNVVNWVQCDSCDKWYHCRCLKITKEEADDLDPYVCVKCELEVEKPESAQALKENCKVQSVLPDRNQFILHQQKDPALLRISSKLESNSANDDGIHKQYVLEEGVLKYVDLTTGVKKVVVPTKLVQDVIIHFHCTPTCPHLGVKKTVERVKDSYWWKGLRKDVEDFIKRCRTCQLVKPVYQKPQGFMRSTTSMYPWEVIAMDLMGPFSTESRGKHVYYGHNRSFFKV